MEAGSRIVVAFVLNAAWQVPVVVLAAAAAARLLPSAAARHRLLLAALGLGLAVPLSGALVGPGALQSGDERTSSPPASSRQEATAWRARLGAAAPHAVAPGPSVRTRRGPAWRRALALRRSAIERPLPEAVRRVAERCRLRLDVGNVAVRLSRAVASPVTLGARHPLILLPEGLVTSLEGDPLAAALGHEMAHVRRSDFAWNTAAELAAVLLAFHPAVAWLLRQLRQARELACDALVAERVLDPWTYARSLAALARSLAAAPAYTLGVADAAILEERVMSLLTGRARRRAGAFPVVAASILLGSASVAAASFAVGVEPSAGPAAVIGAWTGRVEEMGDLPAVDLKVAEKDKQLSGSVTFYAVRVGPQGPTVEGKDVVEMLEPRLDGKRLEFKVKNSRGETLAMVLKLTGKDEGELGTRGVTSDGGEHPATRELLVKMKRVR
ncbi:MAG: hypothetical protein DMF81_03915 [Acidobacteria bacterium]|nr:MAG: hypothetical protein DMF81_03915 [Acidobacteriota bacterium]